MGLRFFFSHRYPSASNLHVRSIVVFCSVSVTTQTMRDSISRVIGGRATWLLQREIDLVDRGKKGESGQLILQNKAIEMSCPKKNQNKVRRSR